MQQLPGAAPQQNLYMYRKSQQDRVQRRQQEHKMQLQQQQLQQLIHQQHEVFPVGWVKEFDPTSQMHYYFNTLTGESSWEKVNL
jgi:hypothetical protein